MAHDPRAPLSAPEAAAGASELKKRVIFGLLLALAAIVVAFIGGLVFALFWTLASVGVLIEWLRISGTSSKAAHVVGAGAIIGSASVLIWPPAGVSPSHAWGVIAAVLVAAACIAAIAARENRLWAFLAVPYAAVLALVPILARGNDEAGFLLVIWLFAIVWGTDVAAYFVGRAVGGPKLWPRVSPKKTWSGFVGGLSAATLLACGVALGLGKPAGMLDWSLATIAVFALLVSIASQGGDLIESAIKRRFDVKDSSHLIPGHGGLMDRLDGFWAACLVVAGLLFWRMSTM